MTVIILYIIYLEQEQKYNNGKYIYDYQMAFWKIKFNIYDVILKSNISKFVIDKILK